MRWLRNRPLRLIIALQLVPAAFPAGADLAPGKWRIARPIRLPALSKSIPVYLPLDAAALAGVENLAEYRIARSDGMETPYRMVEERGQAETYPLSMKTLAASVPGSAQAESVVDLGVRPRGRLRIALAMPGNGFDCTVRVEGSSDLAQWRPLVENGRVFRQPGAAAQNELLLPPHSDRYLRLRLISRQGVPPPIQRIEAASIVRIARRLIEAPATLSRSEEKERQRTGLMLDPGQRTRDIVEARFTVEEPAFKRPVRVEIQEETPEWAFAGQGVIERLASGGEVTLPLNIQRMRRLRLSLADGDDRPLTIGRVTLWRFRRGLIFPAEPGRSYALWYGRPGAEAPDYELQRLPLTVPPADLAVAALEPEQQMPLAPPPPPLWSERHPALLWTALIAVLAMLLAMILRSMRGIRTDLRAAKESSPEETARQDGL